MCLLLLMSRRTCTVPYIMGVDVLPNVKQPPAGYIRGFIEAAKETTKGGLGYYLWLLFLALIVTNGVFRYIYQLQNGLIVTNMRAQVSWGFYISNFTFLVGVAAAAVLLVIPA